MPAGLHLIFLHEIEWRAVTQRAEDNGIRPECAIPAVGDVHAVDDVLVFETARSLNRRIRDADIAAAAHAGREIERVADPTSDRKSGECGAVEIRADRCAGRIDWRRGRDNLNGFLERPDLHGEWDVHGLADENEHISSVDRSE